VLPSEISRCPFLQSRKKHAVASPKCTRAAKVELALEHRNLARGRGARVLEHDEIGLETPRLVSIGCVPAARLAGGVAVGAGEACARAHTR